MRLALAAALASLVSLTGALSPAQMLGLSGYRLTFDEHFSSLDISARGPIGSEIRWIAHTPWNGDFGDARFADPGPAGPFRLTADGLAITATKDAAGRWQSGLICSRDGATPGARGFAQRNGYFEITMKLPIGNGVWPAFWLIGTDASHGTAELDAIEYYGVSNRDFHSTEHLWVHGHDTMAVQRTTSVPPGLLSAGFNTVGVLITDETIGYYLNRRLFWQTPTPPAFRQPMYILADLALGGGWPITGLASPQTMTIRDIRAYAKD